MCRVCLYMCVCAQVERFVFMVTHCSFIFPEAQTLHIDWSSRAFWMDQLNCKHTLCVCAFCLVRSNVSFAYYIFFFFLYTCVFAALSEKWCSMPLCILIWRRFSLDLRFLRSIFLLVCISISFHFQPLDFAPLFRIRMFVYVTFTVNLCCLYLIQSVDCELCCAQPSHLQRSIYMKMNVCRWNGLLNWFIWIRKHLNLLFYRFSH